MNASWSLDCWNTIEYTYNTTFNGEKPNFLLYQKFLGISLWLNLHLALNFLMLSFDVYPGHFTLVDMNCLLLCPCYTVLEVFRWGQDFLKQRCFDPSKEIIMSWTSFKYGLLGLYINWNYIHNVALEILFWNSLHRRQQRCSFWVSWGLPLISPFFAGLAPIDAGWGPWAVSPGAGGPVAGGLSSSCRTTIWRSWSWRFRSWRSRKQSFWVGGWRGF